MEAGFVPQKTRWWASAVSKQPKSQLTDGLLRKGQQGADEEGKKPVFGLWESEAHSGDHLQRLADS